jgi:hypothetical protein
MDRLPDIRDLPIFYAVAQLGSFAKTATELAVSTSYVGKRIEITGLRRTIFDREGSDDAIFQPQTKLCDRLVRLNEVIEFPASDSLPILHGRQHRMRKNRLRPAHCIEPGDVIGGKCKVGGGEIRA